MAAFVEVPRQDVDVAMPVSLSGRKSGTADRESHYMFHADFCFTVFHRIQLRLSDNFDFSHVVNQSGNPHRTNALRSSDRLRMRLDARAIALLAMSIFRKHRANARIERTRAMHITRRLATASFCMSMQAWRTAPVSASAHASADQCIHQRQVLRTSTVQWTCASRGQ